MSNYTKTVDFAAKDTLPSGDSGKIIKGTEFETEFDNISTAIATKADLAGPTFTGILTFASLKGATGATVTTVLDEDDMATNSATALATQQSIKAYVDAQQDTVDTFAEILALSNTTGANDIAVDSAQKVQFRDAAIYLNSSVDGQLDIVADNEIQIAATTIDINGAVDFASTTAHAGNATFADNAKAIFGADSDLQIYHDGFNSYVKDAGTGTLNLQGSTQVLIAGADGTVGVQFIEGANVTLRHNNSPKLTTTSTGIEVTGSVTADGLTVNSGASSTTLNFQNSGTAYSTLYNDTNGVVIFSADAGNTGGSSRMQLNVGGQQAFRIIDGGDVAFYEDTGTTPKFYWDASAESLGIGTSSPASVLEISNNSITTNAVGPVFTLTNESQAVTAANVVLGKLNFSSNDPSGSGGTGIGGSLGVFSERAFDGGPANTYMSFSTRTSATNTERMRIDSSGNLLVSDTAANPSGDNVDSGIALHNAGLVRASTNNAAAPLDLNVKGRDGTIAGFRKDGTTVGSVSTISSDLCIGSSITRVRFDDNGAITPRDGSDANSDATIDLGQPSGRFRKIYLSGGVVLDDNPTAVGGDVTSKTLDDYEEGTWQPVYTSTTNAVDNVNNSRVGYYTKVGNMVYATASLVGNDLSGITSTDHVRIGGLPFTSSNTSAGNDQAVTVGQYRLLLTTDHTLLVPNGQTYVSVTTDGFVAATYTTFFSTPASTLTSLKISLVYQAA